MRRRTQGGASLCPGLSHFAPLGRGNKKTLSRGDCPWFLAISDGNKASILPPHRAGTVPDFSPINQDLDGRIYPARHLRSLLVLAEFPLVPR